MAAKLNTDRNRCATLWAGGGSLRNSGLSRSFESGKCLNQKEGIAIALNGKPQCGAYYEKHKDPFINGNGSFAEYVSAPESVFALKPTNLSFDEAAAVPMAGVTALQGLRDEGKIHPGQKVLINGASGGVGTFAVQIAKSFGAEVTAVCSTRNVEQARSLGADQVIDYTREDFTQSGQHYDLILAANGYHSLSAYKRALTPKGLYVMAGGSQAQIFEAMLLGLLMSKASGKKMGGVSAKPNQEDLVFMKGLLEAGKVVPVIERRYPLSKTAEALRYLGEGHARGKIVIHVEDRV